MTLKLLELFSGTHSIGKTAIKRDYKITSLDMDLPAKSKIYDYTSNNHIKIDIMNWDYKSDYSPGDFDIITASPVCLWWSSLRLCNITKKMRNGKWKNQILTREMIESDIITEGIPMVDKLLEILDYFKPKYWWIENPKTGRMKEYINELIPYVDIDYCQYGFDYKKSTRFWTNINIEAKCCHKGCKKMVKYISKKTGKTSNRHLSSNDGGTKGYKSTTTTTMRYRIPEELINDLLDGCRH